MLACLPCLQHGWEVANGRVVFDDVPAALTEEVARALYGIEAGEVMDTEPMGEPTLTAAAAQAA